MMATIPRHLCNVKRRIGKNTTSPYVLPAAEHYLRVEPLTLEWYAQPLSSDVAEVVDIAVVQGSLDKAAQLAGAVDLLLGRSGKELLAIERGVYERNRAFLNEHLDTTLLEKAWEMGQQMSVEQAVVLVRENEFLHV